MIRIVFQRWRCCGFAQGPGSPPWLGMNTICDGATPTASKALAADAKELPERPGPSSTTSAAVASADLSSTVRRGDRAVWRSKGSPDGRKVWTMLSLVRPAATAAARLVPIERKPRTRTGRTLRTDLL